MIQLRVHPVMNCTISHFNDFKLINPGIYDTSDNIRLTFKIIAEAGISIDTLGFNNLSTSVDNQRF